MNEIYQKNIEAIERHHSYLLNYLKVEREIFEKNESTKSDAPESFEWIQNAEGKPWNIFYRRKNPRFERPLHGSDPQAEAQKILNSTDLRHPTSVIFLGLGAGHLFKEFMANRPANNFAIAVIEKNPQVFFRALCVYDFTAEFKNPDITWCVESHIGKVRCFLLGFFTSFATVNRYLKLVALPSSIDADGEFYQQIAKTLFSARDQSTLSIGNSVPDSLRGLENTVKNIDRALTNPGLVDLFDQFKGKVAISVAAGPSLNEHWETLKAIQGKIPIFACDTLVKPMHDRGIAPDFVTALERDPIVTDFFRGMPINERTSLISPTVLLKDSFEEFKGEHLIYCSTTAYFSVLGISYLGSFFPGHSAGNLNLAAAVKMGFSTLILIGHNLAFATNSGESHVRGTIDPEREKTKTKQDLIALYGDFRVPSQDGKHELQTRVEYNLYRDQIENLVAVTPTTKFVNTALTGAKIEGAEALTLKEALQKYVHEDFDIYPEKKRLIKNIRDKEKASRTKRLLDGVNVAVEVGERYVEEIDTVLASLKEWRLKIEEIEKLGSQVDEEFLNNALDQALDLKVRGVNQDQKFNHAYMSIMSPAHVTFERMLNEMPGYYKSNYELKKDFLLKHEQYYQIWKQFVPEILAQYRLAQIEGEKVYQQYKPKNAPDAESLIDSI